MAIDLKNLLGKQALTYLLQKIKLMKTDLESQISSKSDFSGSYNDLTNKPTIPTKLPTPNKLTFTGGAEGSFDGSEAVSIEIPTPEGLTAATATKLGGVKAATKGTGDTVPAKIGTDNVLYVPTYPTALKNPAALTFTGGASGSYDGSSAKSVKIPIQMSDLTDGDEYQKISDSSLDTTDKTIPGAINEVLAEVQGAETSSKVTVDTSTTTSGMAKSYNIKQGGTSVAVIDIPKDMVVSSGSVVQNPSGQTAGTYLELTLANATSDKVYINVGTLVDIYTAQQSATQVQLTIDGETREISAAIVAGSIGATQLASNAVTTAKIANGAVTKEKLATAVQTSLGKADTALQEDDFAEMGNTVVDEVWNTVFGS